MTDTSDALLDGDGGADGSRLTVLDALDGDVFRSRFGEADRDDHLFGGQVLAQALAAATATTGDMTAHSLHACFIRAGSAARRVCYRVERSRDGRRFATRDVTAIQGNRSLLRMIASFHRGDPGFEHEEPMPPDVPPPEGLPSFPMAAAALGERAPTHMVHGLSRFRLIEGRPTDPEQLVRPTRPARRRFWIRIATALETDEPKVHQQLLAYLSDYFLAGVALVPHPARMAGPELFMASLDHAIWFHAPARADEWLLYDCDSPWAGQGRGLARGTLYRRDGRVVASVTQETVMRPR